MSSLFNVNFLSLMHNYEGILAFVFFKLKAGFHLGSTPHTRAAIIPIMERHSNL